MPMDFFVSMICIHLLIFFYVLQPLAAAKLYLKMWILRPPPDFFRDSVTWF